MGNTYSYPFAFRRTVVSLHYKHHPLFDYTHTGEDPNAEDLRSFWSTLFCSRLSAEEHASFWTAEDVRQLRMYHPDRLAAVLLAAMGQLEAFATAWDSDGGRVDAPSAPSAASASHSHGSATGVPLSRTALLNALRFISGALPYCFESMDELRAVLRADAAEASRDEQNIVIVSQRTVARMDITHRTESPYAEDFAHHFFVCGDMCTGRSEPRPVPALGSRLATLLIRVFFSLHASPWPLSESAGGDNNNNNNNSSRDKDSSPVWPEWSLFQAFLRSPRALVSLATLQRGVATAPQSEERWRAEVLRAVLLALSATLLGARGAAATHAVMARRIFADPLGAQLGAALLYIVRTYPMRVTSFMAWVIGRGAGPAHDAVLGHALTILALGIHAGPVLELPGEEHRVPNTFWHALHAVFQNVDEPDGDMDPSTDDGKSGGVGGNVMEFSNNARMCGGRPYMEKLLASLAVLIKRPNDQPGNGSENDILFRGLALHIVVWILQNGYAERLFPPHAKGGNNIRTCEPISVRDNRTQWLFMLMHCLVRCEFVEVQMGLLCFLALAPSPSFCTFLMEPLLASSSSSSSSSDEAWILSQMRMILPMLPARVSLGHTEPFHATAHIKTDPTNTANTSVNDEAFCMRTYGDVCVLALCYILSPSAPGHHRPLRGTVVEILRALHACCPLCRLLSPHVISELLSSFQHMCSPRVLRPCGKPDSDAARNGARMVQLLLSLVRTSSALRVAVAACDGVAVALGELAACVGPEDPAGADVEALLRVAADARETPEVEQEGESASEREKEWENEKEITTEGIRHLVADGAEGSQWLIAQVWRQAHRANLGMPIFDYRTALLLRVT